MGEKDGNKGGRSIILTGWVKRENYRGIGEGGAMGCAVYRMRSGVEKPYKSLHTHTHSTL